MSEPVADGHSAAKPGATLAAATIATSRFRLRDMLRTRAARWKFSAVLGLQMGQVFPGAFFAVMLPGIFREQQLPLDMFWVFAIPSIPTWLRPLWAPLVDGVGWPRIGLRKTWFIPCTTAGALVYLSLAAFEPGLETLWVIISILFVKSLFMSTQDIAIDGYMVENLEDRERAAGAAVLDIGRNMAQFVSYAGIAWVYAAYGWDSAVTLAAALLVAFSLPAVIRPEPPPPAAAVARRARGERPSLMRLLFHRPDTLLVLPMIFMVAFSGGLIINLYIAFMVDLGWPVGEFAPKVLAPVTLVGTVIGALGAAWLLNRFGYRATILIGALAYIPALIPIIWLSTTSQPGYWAVFGVTMVAIVLPSIVTVAMQAARLKWASKTQAATDYSTQIVTMSMALGAATAVGGFIAEHLGWTLYFSLVSVIIFTVAMGFWALFQRVEDLVDARNAAEVERG